MSLVLSPRAMQVPTAPAVGIFWRVADCLVLERSMLAEAEPYGDCLTHIGGHYECWEAWQALSAPALRSADLPAEIATSEYDDWPRGLVVYEVITRRSVIYADRRLQQATLVVQIRQAFGLNGVEVQVQGDPHYRS